MRRRLLVSKDNETGWYYVEADLVLPSAYVLHIDLSGNERIINLNDLASLPNDVADTFREWMDIVFDQ